MDGDDDDETRKQPPNVHFSRTSMTPLLPEWSNKFDFFNRRLLFAAVLAKEWPGLDSRTLILWTSHLLENIASGCKVPFRLQEGFWSYYEDWTVVV